MHAENTYSPPCRGIQKNQGALDCLMQLFTPPKQHSRWLYSRPLFTSLISLLQKDSPKKCKKRILQQTIGLWECAREKVNVAKQAIHNILTPSQRYNTKAPIIPQADQPRMEIGYEEKSPVSRPKECKKYPKHLMSFLPSKKTNRKASVNASEVCRGAHLYSQLIRAPIVSCTSPTHSLTFAYTHARAPKLSSVITSQIK